jgi:hypothetical protein
MTDTHSDLLRTFIANENEAFRERFQGKFWPLNHHRITPLATKADGLLDPHERVNFYFHFMRVTGDVPRVGDKEMPLLLDAYTRLLPFLDLGGIIQMARRHVFLFVFGFDEIGVLPSGKTTSAKALKSRLKLVVQVGNYISQPTQREKKAKFATFADEAVRILETLRHLGYRHDRRYDDEAIYNTTDLSFWGMIFVGLLTKATRADFAADMVEGKYDLVRRDEQIGMLHRYVDAVFPEIEPDEEHFRSLALRLREIERARRNATDSVALAKRLNLPFDADEEWDIFLSIPLRGSMEHALIAKNVVQLRIQPRPDWQWNLSVRLAERGKYIESEKSITQNDLDFPMLGSGNLHAFPTWLKQVRENSGLDFDIEAADIRVGRKRAAAKLISQWLASS